MITVRLRGLDKLQKELRRIEREAPKALARALNTTAFDAQKRVRAEYGRGLTLRNDFVPRSVAVDMVPRGATGQLRSAVGVLSRADFMAAQESGGMVPKKAVPLRANLGNPNRPIPKGRRLARIQAKKAHAGKTRQQRNAAALGMARRAGHRFVVLESKRGRKGIYAVTSKSIKLLYSAEQRGAHIRGRHLFERAVSAAQAGMRNHIERELGRLLRGGR